MSSKNRGDILRTALAAPTTVATEDFNSFKNHVSNFMTRFQSEWRASWNNVADLTKSINGIRATARKKKGIIRSDAPDIKMRSYAKWLSVNGKVLTDADHIVLELEKASKIAELFTTSWWDAYNGMVSYAADKVLRHGMRNMHASRTAMANTFTSNKPAGFDAIMTKHEEVHDPFEERTVRAPVSEYFLGHWRAAKVGRCSREFSYHYSGSK